MSASAPRTPATPATNSVPEIYDVDLDLDDDAQPNHQQYLPRPSVQMPVPTDATLVKKLHDALQVVNGRLFDLTAALAVQRAENEKFQHQLNMLKQENQAWRLKVEAQLMNASSSQGRHEGHYDLEDEHDNNITFVL
jgi:hypothetical protein